MSISAILGSMGNTASAIASQFQAPQLQRLGQDLMSGNLSGAQSDFATLQQALSQSGASTSASSTSNPVTQAFQQLSSDLTSGNLSAAQKDYSSIQQNLESDLHLHNHHRVRMGGGGEPGQTPGQTSNLQSPLQLGQDLSASQMTAAQQAYASLQNALGSATGLIGTNSAALSLATPSVFDSGISLMA
ncbi:MAG: hypothetical protein ABSD39_13445 [Terriglobales bacterium]|jgi:hypothetical protein